MELSFTHITTADILIYKDELLFGEEFRGSQVLRGSGPDLGRNAVRSAHHEDGISLRVGEDIFRHVNGNEQPDAIAHRNFVFVFRIVLANESELCLAEAGGCE